MPAPPPLPFLQDAEHDESGHTAAPRRCRPLRYAGRNAAGAGWPATIAGVSGWAAFRPQPATGGEEKEDRKNANQGLAPLRWLSAPSHPLVLRPAPAFARRPPRPEHVGGLAIHAVGRV